MSLFDLEDENYSNSEGRVPKHFDVSFCFPDSSRLMQDVAWSHPRYGHLLATVGEA